VNTQQAFPASLKSWRQNVASPQLQAQRQVVVCKRQEQFSVQPPTCTSVVNVTLPAFAAERRAAAPLLLSAGACCTAPAARPQLSIDIFCPQCVQQQTRRTPLLLSVNGTDRQTD